MKYKVKNKNLLDEKTPLAFCDGTEVYDKLAQEYKTHKKGFYIVAPSGAGKTYFVDSQKTKHWIDGDTLWMATKAHPAGPWWLKSLEQIFEVERRSDVITEQAKRLGFWIVGSDCYSILPDAVAIPNWKTHKKYILSREKGEFDGGVTSNDFEKVKRTRRYLRSFAKKDVPIFKSIDEAADFLSSKNL